jgi:hypothetical protein
LGSEPVYTSMKVWGGFQPSAQWREQDKYCFK